ncbi:SlyX protein [Hasllibacter halocynthiae]|uniref:SlyX protein n=1 Tax=Hasllibacter halocynthiae TaxID=595589 RepID=A0A2T0X1A2_9RHOB|nr:SlyX family protein [Hasllibacter halocynthiae]PRY92634.1 SlyX protein [Hasllibacter halocynthiae]
MDHEERIAWLERDLADLSAVVARQDAEIARLATLADRLARAEADRRAEGGGGVVMGDERPPHW